MRQTMPRDAGSIAFGRLVRECRRLSSADAHTLVEQILPELERELMSVSVPPLYHRLHQPWRNLVLSRQEPDPSSRGRACHSEDEQRDDQPAGPEQNPVG